MTELDDIDGLGAEYVLGTLSRDERRDVAQRRASEPELDRAINAWERRMGPLVEVVAPVQPSASLYSKIRAQIGLSQHVISLKTRELALKRRARRWRGATAGMSAIAATLAGVIGWQEFGQPPMPTQFVAVLQSVTDKPAFLMTIDMKSHMCVITAVSAPKTPEKSYEVWLVNDKLPKPKSLGVYVEGDMGMMPMDPDTDNDMFMNATYAVSLEPEGGSPTGAPTGPVLFTGKLIQATP
jgi:anti-sigma-K factor RskA